MSTRTRPKISPYHKRVLSIGLPFIFITPFLWVAASYQALEPSDPDLRRRAAFNDRVVRTFTGEGSVDDQALHISQALFVIWLVSMVLTIVFAALPSIRNGRRSKTGAHLDLRFAFKDAPFWQVGDRAGWHEDGAVVTGVVVEIHRRPFEFAGELIQAVAGIPGLVMKNDATGELVARKLASVYRITGTTGPSGTMDSIREAMNAAVQPGDGFAWLDKDGEPVDGVVVSIHTAPFAVGGKRGDASEAQPGYIVARNSDKVQVGVTSGKHGLREL